MELKDAIKSILKLLEAKGLQRPHERFLYVAEVLSGEREPDQDEHAYFQTVLDFCRSEQYNGDDIMGMFFGEWNIIQKKHTKGQVFTPEHIVSLIHNVLNVGENDVLFDGACGTGALLTKGIPAKVKAIYGIEYDADVCRMAQANFKAAGYDNAEIRNMDTSTTEAGDWIKSLPITKSINNPPYENKFHCIPIVINILDNLPSNTECVFILPDKKFEKASKKQKEHIFAHHRITKCIKLPKDTFYGVGVETSLFFFITGEPQAGHQIFTAYIEDSGLVTVKNQMPQDIHNKWSDIEKHWVDVIQTETGDETIAFVDPAEHLSYQMPEQPFVITEEDMRKAAFDYACFLQGIDVKKLMQSIAEQVVYGSEITADDEYVIIKIKKKKAG